MNTSHVDMVKEEARLYEELRAALEDVPEGAERQLVMKRMIRQVKYSKWRNACMNGIKNSWGNARPTTLWIWIATGALAPVVFFCLFIWASLWVE